MPSTRREWERCVRDIKRALRDAKKARRYAVTAQTMGVLIFGTGITLCAVFASLGWIMLALLGMMMFGIATAMVLEWTLYQDVMDARDKLEDVTADYDEWKLEQAMKTVETY